MKYLFVLITINIIFIDELYLIRLFFVLNDFFFQHIILVHIYLLTIDHILLLIFCFDKSC